MRREHEGKNIQTYILPPQMAHSEENERTLCQQGGANPSGDGDLS